MKKSIKRLISFGLCFMLAFSNTCSSFSGMSVYAADAGISTASDNPEEASPSDAEVQDSSDLNNQSTKKFNKIAAPKLNAPSGNGTDEPAAKAGDDSLRGDPDDAPEHFLSINGTPITLSNHTIDGSSYVVHYGDEVVFTLDDTPLTELYCYVFTIPSSVSPIPEYFDTGWTYYGADQQTGERPHDKWTLVPDSYYAGFYYFPDDDSDFIMNASGDFGFTVVKGTFSAPTDPEWDEKTATWNAVTTTVSGGEAAENSVMYEVNLYRGSNTTPIRTATVSDTSVDFSNYIDGYGKYHFTVRAVPVADSEDPSKDFTDLYNSSATTESGDYEIPDVTSPVIKTFSGENGVLTAVASDDEAGVLYYAFSTEASSTGISSWSQLNNAVVGEDATISYTLQDNDHGIYYVHVKDADGNVSTSTTTITVTHVIYNKYYDSVNNLYTKHSYVIGDTVNLVSDLVRPGYNFEGWVDSSDTIVTTVSAGSEATVTASWVRSDIEITTQPQNITCDYDGTDHTLTAAVSNNLVGNVTWNWYKVGDDTPISTSTGKSTTLNLKNVSDSGTYYAEATITLSDGEDSIETVSTKNAVVTISRKALTITPDDITLYYGDSTPDSYDYEADGLVSSDSDILTGQFKSNYVTGDDAGDYVISIDPDHPFEADNYNIAVKDGTLTVNPKVVTNNANITVELADSSEEFIYDGTAYTPEVVVKDNGVVIPSSEYSVSYSDNIGAGTAKINLVFQNNYTGTKTLEFTIQKENPSAEVVFEKQSTPAKIVSVWPYGTKVTLPGGSGSEIVLKTNTNSDSNSKVYHFLDAAGNELPTNAIPTALGSYKVYVVIAETDNYESVQSEPVDFEIVKRPLDIMVISGYVQEYDGEEHRFTDKDITIDFVNGTSFASGEGLSDYTIDGSITDVGSIVADEQSIHLTPLNGTDLDNYEITIVPDDVNDKDKVIIVPQKLDEIDGLKWSEEYNEAGVAEWTARSIAESVSEYTVSLYRISTDDNEDTRITTVTTETPSFDFSPVIKDDVIAQNNNSETKKAYDYYFTVSVAAKNNDNYESSEVTSGKNTAVMHTALVYTVMQEGVTDISIGANADGYIVMLQGESANATITFDSGYSNPYSWSDPSVLSIKNPDLGITSFTLKSDITQSYDRVDFISRASDEAPVIESFTGETNGDYTEVSLGFTASDSRNLQKWMITQNSSMPDEDAPEWNVITEDQLVTEDGRVKILYDTTLTDVTSQGEGTYYVFVMDGSNNISRSDPLDVYKLSFNKGTTNTACTGTMGDIYKVENVSIVLPALGFTYPGFAFVNWTTDDSTYQNEATYSANSSDTLVAHWSDKVYGYTVEYYMQDTEGNYPSTATKSAAFSCAYNSTIGPNISAILLNDEGFTLDTELSETNTIDSDNMTVKLYYSRNKYTLKYTLTKTDNTKEVVSEEELYYGETIETREKPEEPGYTFVGWSYSDTGSKPDTMPAHNVSASGYYIANEGTYVINYYLQNLDNDNNYTLISTEQIPSTQGNVIDTSSRNEIEGFTFAGRNSIYIGTEPSQVVTVTSDEMAGYQSEEDPTVSAVEGQILNINYYYTRDVYPLTLNIWKNEDRDTIVYTNVWNLKYGTPIIEDDYIHYNEAEWDSLAEALGVNTEKYSVSEASSWSTGLEAPTSMPAGPVSVSRQYIPIFNAKYKVKVYLQNSAGEYPDDDSPNYTLMYDGPLGSNATVGNGNTYSVNIDDFGFYIPYFDICYDLDTDNSDLVGEITDSSENPDNMLVLKLKMKRKEIAATIRYIYRDVNGHPTEFATFTRKGLWSTSSESPRTSYTVDPLLYFYGSNYSGLNEEAINSVASGVTVNGESPINYNFNTHNCAVSYSYGFNYSSGTSTFSTKPTTITSYFGTPSGYKGTSHSVYVNVYYTELDPDKSFVFDFYINKNVDNKYLESEEAKTEPITYTGDLGYGEHTYRLREANLSYLVNTEFMNGAQDDDYLAGSIIRRSGQSGEVKEGFAPVTINYHTYYVTTSPDANGNYYIYIANSANNYYPGRYCYASYSGNVSSDIPFVDNWLADYKNRHSDPDDENRDTKAAALYIYNRSHTVLKAENSDGSVSNESLYVNFAYGDTYNLTLCLHEPSGEIKSSSKAFVKGSNISNNDITSFITSSHFTERVGYDIVWYLDQQYTQPVTSVTQFTNISSDVILHGRYEKAKLKHHLYTHYMTKGIDYVTIDDVVDEHGVKNGYQVLDVESNTVTYQDDDGNNISVDVYTTTYGTDSGDVVLKDVEIPGTAYTELKLTTEDIDKYNMPSGFYYDESNTNNKTYAYCEYSAVKFHIYYARNKHTFKVNNKYDKDNVVNSSIKRYGETVTVEDPVKPGYDFKGWDVKKIVQTVDDEGNEVEEYVDLPSGINVTISEPSGGIRTFEMPDCDIILIAKWQNAPFDTVIRHYFQTVNKNYYTGIEDDISGMTSTNIDTNYGEGSVYELADKTIIVVNKNISSDDYTLYFVVDDASGGAVTLNPENLAMATTEITVVSGDVMDVDDYIFPVGSDFDMFDFAYMNYTDTQLGETVTKDGVTTSDDPLYDQTKFTCKFGMENDYYYTRTSGLVVKLLGFATDDSTDTGLTLTGDGTYLYGKDVTISAILASGYTFVGWFDADDVLDDSDSLDMDKLAQATPISSTDTSPYQFDTKVKSSVKYVAVSTPEEIGDATLTISGKSEYTYGYANSSSNKLSATVTYNEGVDSSKYTIKSYQWYLVNEETSEAEDIFGANSGVLNFETGKNAGTYIYRCKVTIEHLSNGRTLEVWADPYEVTVHKKDLTIDVISYTGVYDGESHNVTVSVGGLVGNDQAVVYYSTEPLDADNYSTAGKVLAEFSGVKDVKVNNIGEVIATDVYLYAVSADPINSNYNSIDGSGTVTLTPKTVAITAKPSAEKFERLYDGTPDISGDVNTPGTAKYEIAHGGYILISGLTDADIASGVADNLFVDFTGKYNSKDVQKAAKITLSDLSLVDDNGKKNVNYIIPKSLDIEGRILKVPVTVNWPSEENRTFIYNGSDQVLHPTGVTVEEPSNTKLSDEISQFVITVSGAKKNINTDGGKYTATANVAVPAPSTNYEILQKTCEFTIVKRTIYVDPDDNTVTYDGNAHGLDDYTLYDYDQQTEYVLPAGLNAESYEYDKKYTNAGTYNDIATTNLVIKEGSIDASYNYNIEFLSGTLTITRKVVTVSGITAEDKSFDGSTAATVNLDNIVIDSPIDGEALKVNGITGAFESATQGNDKTVNLSYVNAVLAADNGSTLADNYQLDVDNSQQTTTADITGHDVKINTDSVEGIYGEDLSNLFGFTYGDDYTGSQFVPNDSDKKVTGNPTYMVIPQGETTAIDYSPSLPAGTYTIIVVTDSADNTVTGMSCDNYKFTEGTRGTLTINKRPIAIVEAVGEYAKIEKTYDGDVNVLTPIINSNDNTYYQFVPITGDSASGVISGDTVLINQNYTSKYNSKDVSDADKVTLTGVTIDNENYVLKTQDGTADNDTLVLNNAGITKQELIVTAKNKQITYGDSAPEYTVSYSGFVTGENSSVLDALPTCNCEYDTNDSTKRGVGVYTITPSGAQDDNYSFNYVDGKLTVNRSKIAVVADDKRFTYSEGVLPGGTLPDWTGDVRVDGYTNGSTSYDGLRYTEDATGGITGSPEFACPGTDADGIYTVPGDYDIDASVGTLSSDNYEFVYIVGTLTIDKKDVELFKDITAGGITINPKVYDGTTAVLENRLVKPEVNSTNYDGISDHDIAAAGEGIEFDVSHMSYNDKNVGTDRVVSLTYDDNGTIKYAYRLNDYLAARYTLNETHSQQTIENAVITKAPLTIKADDIPVSPAIFRYGDAVPIYTATFTGFVPGEDEGVLHGEPISFDCAYSATGGTFSSADEYTITPSGYELEEAQGNYHIVFEPGTLTVTPSEFEKPVVLWSNTVPGLITWTRPDDIGGETVASYELTLYRADTATGEFTKVSGSEVTLNSPDITLSEGVYTYDYHGLLDDSKGLYKVQVKAVSSNEANTKSSISDLENADITYSTLVTVKFASDDVSQAGKDTAPNTTIHGENTSYIMVAGDADFPYTAVLKGYRDVDDDNVVDCTGYDVKSVASDNAKLIVTDGTKLNGRGTVYQDGTVSAGFDIATTDADIIVTLSANQPNVTPGLSFKDDDTATSWSLIYNYTDAPTIQCNIAVGDADLNTDDYTYTYKWHVKRLKGVPDDYSEDTADSNLFDFPLGRKVNPDPHGYYVSCEVTATRKDNGLSKTFTAEQINYVKVEKATMVFTVSLDGWTYGEVRNAPSISPEHPEQTDPDYSLTYSYCDTEDGTYTYEIPKDAGTYYVKAHLAGTTNYSEYNTAPTQFVISKAKLDTPQGVLQKSPSAPFGGISWSSVPGPEENNGVTGDSDSHIIPSYKVTLYRKDTLTSDPVSLNEVTVPNDGPLKIEDWTNYMVGTGLYYFTIQAISDKQNNCLDSDIFVSDYIDIERVIVDDRNNIVYDGNPITLSLTGSSVPAGATYQWYKDGEEITGATDETYHLTDVAESGKYTCVVSAAGESYTYSTIDTITINRRPITITTDSGDKIYDGSPLTRNVVSGTNKNYKIELDAGTQVEQGAYVCNTPLVSTDTETMYITGSQTQKGSSLNTFTLSVNHGSTTIIDGYVFNSDTTVNFDNYSITSKLGTLEVGARDITVIADDLSKVYGDPDPSTLTWHVDSNTPIADGENLENISVTRVAGEDEGTYTITASQPDGSNANYNITFETGTFTINLKPLIIKADPDSKIFGESDPALTYKLYTLDSDNNRVQIASTALPFGDQMSGTLLRTVGEDVGEYTINRNTVNVSNATNYQITYEDAIFKIVRKGIKVIPTDASKTYGDADPALAYSVEATTGNNAGQTIQGLTLSGIDIHRDAGETVANSPYEIYSGFESGADTLTNPNYDITFETGEFTITPATLTVNAENKTKVYGDTEPEYTYIVLGLKLGDLETDVLEGALNRVPGENVGDYDINQGTLGLVSGNNNYTLSFEGAKFTITSKDITVIPDSLSKTYGDADPTLTYTVQNNALISGDSLSDISVTRDTGEDVGPYTITASQPDGSNKNYNITFENGTFTINQKPLIIKADSDSKIFGESDPALTYKLYTLDSDNNRVQIASTALPFGNQMSGTLLRTEGEGVGEYTINRNTVNVSNASNYQITYEDAIFEIVRKGIKVIPTDASKTYGDTDPALTYTVEATTGSDAGQTIQGLTLSGIDIHRDAGETVANSPYEIYSGFESSADTSTNPNYDITFETGEFTISKKAITVTAGSSSRRYDGSPLTDDTYEITDTNTGNVIVLPRGDSVQSITINGTITTAGSVPNEVTDFVIYNNNEDVTSSYDITFVNGTLTILSGSLIVIAGSGAKVYDGEPLEVDTVTCVDASNHSASGLAAGETITATVTGSQTDAGSSENTITQGTVKIMKDGVDVTNSYTISEYRKGTLTVTKRPLTITSGTDEREYDGTEFKLTSYTTDNLVTGHSVDQLTWTYTKEDSTDPDDLTSVGEITNKITSAKIVDENGTDVKDNYDITFVSGKSKITKKSDVIIKTASAEKTYDGSELVDNDYDIVGSLANGDAIDTFETGTKPKNAGSYENVPSTIVIKNSRGQDVTSNYDLGYDYGTLTINKRQVTFTSLGDEKIYDGTPLTNPEVVISGDGMVPGENVVFNVTGSQTYVGSSENTFTYTITSGNRRMLNARTSRLFAAPPILAAPAPVAPMNPEDNYSITKIQQPLVVTDTGIVTTTKTHEDKTYKLGDAITFDISITNIYDSAKDITVTEKSGVVFENGSNVYVISDVPSGETRTVKATHVVTEEDIANGSGAYDNTVDVKFDGVTTDHSAEDSAKIDVPSPSWYIDFDIVSDSPDGVAKYKVGDTITYRLKITNDGNQSITVKDISDVFTREDGSKVILSDAALAKLRSLVGTTIKPGEAAEVEFDYLTVDADKDTKLLNTIDVTITTKESDGASSVKEVSETLSADATSVSVEAADEAVAPDATVKEPEKSVKAANTKSPGTADNTPLAGAMVMLVLSAAGILAVIRKRRTL